MFYYNKHRMTQCNATAKSTGKRCSKQESNKHNGFCHCHQTQEGLEPTTDVNVDYTCEGGLCMINPKKQNTNSEKEEEHQTNCSMIKQMK